MAKFNQLRKRTGEDARVAPLIREWRKHRGLTQQTLAEQIGISRSYLALIELGKRSCPQEVRSAIAVVLKCSRADLLEGGPANSDDILLFWSSLTEAERIDGLEMLRSMFAKKKSGRSAMAAKPIFERQRWARN